METKIREMYRIKYETSDTDLDLNDGDAVSKP